MDFFSKERVKDITFFSLWTLIFFNKKLIIPLEYVNYFDALLGLALSVYLYSSPNEVRKDLGTLVLGIYLGLSIESLSSDILGKEAYLKALDESWIETSPFNWFLVLFLILLTYRLRKTFSK